MHNISIIFIFLSALFFTHNSQAAGTVTRPLNYNAYNTCITTPQFLGTYTSAVAACGRVNQYCGVNDTTVLGNECFNTANSAKIGYFTTTLGTCPTNSTLQSGNCVCNNNFVPSEDNLTCTGAVALAPVTTLAQCQARAKELSLIYSSGTAQLPTVAPISGHSDCVQGCVHAYKKYPVGLGTTYLTYVGGTCSATESFASDNNSAVGSASAVVAQGTAAQAAAAAQSAVAAAASAAATAAGATSAVAAAAAVTAAANYASNATSNEFPSDLAKTGDIQNQTTALSAKLDELKFPWEDVTSNLGSVPAAEDIPSEILTLSSSPVSFATAAGCPAPITFNINLPHLNQTYNIGFEPFCDLASILRPIFLALGAITAAFIFAAGLTI